MLLRRLYAYLFVAGCIFTIGSIIYLNQTFPKRKAFYNESSTTYARFGGEIQRSTKFSAKDSPTSKPFIYLTQTEQCLPLKLRDTIGNITCNCDVIVLSYQAECNKTNNKTPSHVTYMFDPGSTWNTGRNALYFTALKRTPGYHYYIFLDDDTDLTFNHFAPPEMKTIQPFRVIQEWLLDYEPVVGVLNYNAHHGAKWTLKKRKKLCSIYDTSLVLPVVWFDAIFQAFHHEAIGHILPYSTEYDKVAWYFSAARVFAAVELKFRGQALMFAAVTAKNPKHRKYPRAAEQFDAAFRNYIKEIQHETPTPFQSHTIFKKFQKNPRLHTSTSLTYCMNVTRHLSIVPYAHFDHYPTKPF